MAKIPNPEFLKPEFNHPVKRRQLKYGYPIIITFLAIALGIVIYMIYLDYYEPNYKLINFLPEEYTLAIEYKKNDDSLSKIQLLEILNQPTFQEIYLTASSQINNYISSWPLTIQSSIKQTKEGVLFLTDKNSYGLIVKLNSKKLAKKIKETSKLKETHFMIIKNKVLIIAKNQETLDQITNTKTQSLSPFNMEISLTPWLRVYFNDNFFIQNFSDSLLTDIQTILNPLSLKAENQYKLQVTNESHQLIIELIPEILVEDKNQLVLDNYLNYLPQDSKISFGVNDLNNLSGQLDTNVNLNNYFKQADFLTWIKNQLSISSLIKNLKGPIIISKSDNYWSILTNISNQETIDGQIKNYIAQFRPITQKIVLPDGTLSTELIADPSSIAWNIAEKDGWQLFSYDHPKQDNLIGYAVKNDKMIASNKIDDFDDFSQVNNCILPNISSFIKIQPQNNELLIFDFSIQNFANISAISSTNGHIKICLDLK